MAVSTIPAAKRALLAGLQARQTGVLAGVLVRWGIPAELQREQDRIFVTSVRDVAREWGSIGNRCVEEIYTIDVVCEAIRPGDDAQASEERMWVLVDEVDDLVRDDPSLGNLLVSALPTFSDQVLGPADDDSWLARITVSVDCTAHI